MTVTIQDIADNLGLAPSTVSKVLNAYPHVSTETRRRVLEKARELNYYPRAAARDLRLRRTNRVGFSYGYTTTDIGEYASRIINGAVAAAEKAGFNVLLYPLTGDQLGKLTRICRAREVAGLLLMGGNQLTQSIDLLQDERTPFIVLNRELDMPGVSFVTADYRTATREAIQHLVKLGHTRIAYISQPALEVVHAYRVASFQQALREANLEYDENIVMSAGSTEAGAGYQEMKKLLELEKRPTAVMAIHDQLAIECLQAVTDAGLSVPEDVAIVGSDNLRETQSTEPPLTTIHPPLADVGRLAMESLLLRITDESLPPTRLILPAQVVIRQSTIGTAE